MLKDKYPKHVFMFWIFIFEHFGDCLFCTPRPQESAMWDVTFCTHTISLRTCFLFLIRFSVPIIVTIKQTQPQVQCSILINNLKIADYLVIMKCAIFMQYRR